jgi:hypothetical protein
MESRGHTGAGQQVRATMLGRRYRAGTVMLVFQPASIELLLREISRDKIQQHAKQDQARDGIGGKHPHIAVFVTLCGG